jgi:hypothetical protein
MPDSHRVAEMLMPFSQSSAGASLFDAFLTAIAPFSSLRALPVSYGSHATTALLRPVQYPQTLIRAAGI